MHVDICVLSVRSDEVKARQAAQQQQEAKSLPCRCADLSFGPYVLQSLPVGRLYGHRLHGQESILRTRLNYTFHGAPSHSEHSHRPLLRLHLKPPKYISSQGRPLHLPFLGPACGMPWQGIYSNTSQPLTGPHERRTEDRDHFIQT